MIINLYFSDYLYSFIPLYKSFETFDSHVFYSFISLYEYKWFETFILIFLVHLFILLTSCLYLVYLFIFRFTCLCFYVYSVFFLLSFVRLFVSRFRYVFLSLFSSFPFFLHPFILACVLLLHFTLVSLSSMIIHTVSALFSFHPFLHLSFNSFLPFFLFSLISLYTFVPFLSLFTLFRFSLSSQHHFSSILIYISSCLSFLISFYFHSSFYLWAVAVSLFLKLLLSVLPFYSCVLFPAVNILRNYIFSYFFLFFLPSFLSSPPITSSFFLSHSPVPDLLLFFLHQLILSSLLCFSFLPLNSPLLFPL